MNQRSFLRVRVHQAGKSKTCDDFQNNSFNSEHDEDMESSSDPFEEYEGVKKLLNGDKSGFGF